jgi:hypothetical protein
MSNSDRAKSSQYAVHRTQVVDPDRYGSVRLLGNRVRAPEEFRVCRCGTLLAHMQIGNQVTSGPDPSPSFVFPEVIETDTAMPSCFSPVLSGLRGNDILHNNE